MTKLELIDALAKRFPQLVREDANMAARLILDQMSATLVAGGRIEIRDFGRFTVHHLLPRVGHNPKTGVKVSVPSKSVPHFKPGKGLCEAVDPGRKAAQQALHSAPRLDSAPTAQKTKTHADAC